MQEGRGSFDEDVAALVGSSRLSACRFGEGSQPGTQADSVSQAAESMRETETLTR